MDQQTIAERVRSAVIRLRASRRHRQIDAAELAGIGHMRLRRMESGEGRRYLHNVAVLSKAYGVPLAALVARPERTCKAVPTPDMEVLRTVLARRIAALRAERGDMQRSLALHVGVDQSAISKLESGVVTRPSLDLLARVADFFGETLPGFLEATCEAALAAQPDRPCEDETDEQGSSG